MNATLEQQLVEGGIICDPYLEGSPRFGAEPVVLSGATLDAMCTVAEKVAGVYDEMDKDTSISAVTACADTTPFPPSVRRKTHPSRCIAG